MTTNKQILEAIQGIGQRVEALEKLQGKGGSRKSRKSQQDNLAQRRQAALNMVRSANSLWGTANTTLDGNASFRRTAKDVANKVSKAIEGDLGLDPSEFTLHAHQ